MKRRNPVLHAMGVSALIVAVEAGPAWAADEAYLAMRPSTPDEWVAAHEICRRVESNPAICAMINAYTQAKALETAKIVLDDCDVNPTNPVFNCDEARAYIKQRWGY